MTRTSARVSAVLRGTYLALRQGAVFPTDRRQRRACRSERAESLISFATPLQLAPSYELRPRESEGPSQDRRGRGTARVLLHGAGWLLRGGRGIQSKGSSWRPSHRACALFCASARITLASNSDVCFRTTSYQKSPACEAPLGNGQKVRRSVRLCRWRRPCGSTIIP